MVNCTKDLKPIRPSSALALAAAGLISGCAPREPLPPPATTAATSDTDPQARGLNPPTPEERARMDAMSKKNPETVPNELARERLNAERKAQGLPPLPAPPPSKAAPK